MPEHMFLLLQANSFVNEFSQALYPIFGYRCNDLSKVGYKQVFVVQ